MVSKNGCVVTVDLTSPSTVTLSPTQLFHTAPELRHGDEGFKQSQLSILAGSGSMDCVSVIIT